MVAPRNMVTARLLLVVTMAHAVSAAPAAAVAAAANDGVSWPGPLLAALLGVVIVVFVLIRWRSKP